MRKIRGVVMVTAALCVVILLSPGCVSQYVRSAKIYIQQNDHENAKEELLKGKDVTPDDPQLLYLLGKVHAELEEWEEMNAAFDRTMELSDMFDSDIDATRKESWRIVFNKGVKPFNKEDWAKALENFETALIIIPGKHETIMQIGLCHLQLQNLEKAEEFLKASIDSESEMTTKNPDDPKVDFSSRINLLNIYVQGARWEEVVTMSEEILKIDSSRVDVIDKIALAYQQLGKNEEAIAAWDEVIKVHPEKSDYHFNKANILYRMERFDDAAEAYKNALKYNPEDEEAYSLLTNCLLRLENWAGLVELLEPVMFPGGTVEEIENPDPDVNLWKILNAAYVNMDLNDKALVVVKIIYALEKEE